MYREFYQEFKPKSTFLKKFINGYNLFQTNQDFQIRYCLFPQKGAVVAVVQDAFIQSKPNYTLMEHHEGLVNYVGLGVYKKPYFFEYKGAVKEMAVNFKPMAINFFFDDSYQNMFKSSFITIEPCKIMDGINKSLSLPTDEVIDFMDDLFANAYHKKQTYKLEEYLDAFIEDDSISVTDLADQLAVSPRTLLRIFKKYLTVSPTDFKKICKFRNAINLQAMSPVYASIADLSFDCEFYDNSHFSREFKKLTNESPGAFFEKVEYVGEEFVPLKLI